jgi:hypothetical protein
MERNLSFAKTLRGHKSRPVTMLQAHLHAIHFKRILDFGEGQAMQALPMQRSATAAMQLATTGVHKIQKGDRGASARQEHGVRTFVFAPTL